MFEGGYARLGDPGLLIFADITTLWLPRPSTLRRAVVEGLHYGVSRTDLLLEAGPPFAMFEGGYARMGDPGAFDLR